MIRPTLLIAAGCLGLHGHALAQSTVSIFGTVDLNVTQRRITISDDEPGTQPSLAFEGYRSTALRHPKKALHLLPHRLTELTGPVFGSERVGPGEDDLTHHAGGEAIGQRIVVHGRLLDSDGRKPSFTQGFFIWLMQVVVWIVVLLACVFLASSVFHTSIPGMP